MCRRRRPGWTARRRRGTVGTPPPGAAPRSRRRCRARRPTPAAPPVRRPAGCCRSRRRRPGTLPRPGRARRTAARSRFSGAAPGRCRPGPVVVRVQDRRLARGGEFVFGDDLTGGRFDDQQTAPCLAPRPRWCRSAGSGTEYRADAYRTQDSRSTLRSHRRRPDLQPQRRQRAQHFSFDDQPLVRDRADLRVHRGVDFGAPRGGGGVGRVHAHRPAGRSRPRSAAGRPGRVGRSRTRFSTMPFDCGILGVAEVRGETVMRRPTGRSPGSGPPRSRPPRPSGTPSGRPAPSGRNPTDRGQRLGDQRQRRGGLSRRWRTRRTATARTPAPRRTGATPARLGPVDHQVLTRRPHRRAATAVMIPAPQRFLAPRPAGGSSAPNPRTRPPERPAATASPRSGLATPPPARRPARSPRRSSGPARPRRPRSRRPRTRSMTRLTVLWVVPQISAAPRYVPTC